MTDHIIQSEDGQTYDLTTNRIAFGLLPEDVQRAMNDWPHGWEMYDSSGQWDQWPTPLWSFPATYRAIPAPKVTEHVLYWRDGMGAWPYRKDSDTYRDTHRITLRDDGKGNLTATVEKL
jgi:hypothetical protein